MTTFTCDITLMVTADDEDEAYSLIADSGFMGGAKIGFVTVYGLDVVESWDDGDE